MSVVKELMPSILRPNEIKAIWHVKKNYKKMTKVDIPEHDRNLLFCYNILTEVSRSFAAVIICLNEELRDAVCIFYLVLRALDTIEDDMSIEVPVKLRELPIFHTRLDDKAWSIDGIGVKEAEKLLLQEYFRVSEVFHRLKPAYQDIIKDICHKMALGMCHYLQNIVVSVQDYNLYCHFVAGLVGHGLTRLWAASGLESPRIADNLSTSNEMGLFLQKCNIIRDYYEDICESPPRIFWPKDIWGQYTDQIQDFKEPENLEQALDCLNAMVADALTHVPSCLEYMSHLTEPSIFLFCAIPQAMAVATLAAVANNPRVFNSVVKIRKGLACRIITEARDMEALVGLFDTHLQEIATKIPRRSAAYSAVMAGINNAYASKHMQGARAVGERQSLLRRLITSFPALGGDLMYKVVDTLNGSASVNSAAAGDDQ